jgi:hypothetical protein
MWYIYEWNKDGRWTFVGTWKKWKLLKKLKSLNKRNVTTLALGSQPRQKHGKCVSQKCNPRVTLALLGERRSVWRNVWRNEPTHSQVDFHFGSWSPYGVLNFWRASLGFKTHWIKNFFIKLKCSWNVNI